MEDVEKSTAGCKVAENNSMLVWQKDLKDYLEQRS